MILKRASTERRQSPLNLTICQENELLPPLMEEFKTRKRIREPYRRLQQHPCKWRRRSREESSTRNFKPQEHSSVASTAKRRRHQEHYQCTRSHPPTESQKPFFSPNQLVRSISHPDENTKTPQTSEDFEIKCSRDEQKGKK